MKAVHIVNPSGKKFEGLNIYEANDEVRIYIVPLQATAREAGEEAEAEEVAVAGEEAVK